MFNFITKFFTKVPFQTGALLDIRSLEEKKDDILFKDIVAKANIVNWTEKSRESWRQFPSLNQRNSYMCAANSFAKALGIAYGMKYGTYIPFSRIHIYQRRFNKIEGGMSVYELDLIGRQGITLEQLTPKEVFTDSDSDSIKIEKFKEDVGKIFAVGGLIYADSNIDTIASIIQTTGKGVMLLTYFMPSEWSKEFPIIEKYNLNILTPSTARHFVVAVDFTLYNGKKCLIIEDSAWFGGINRRIISEEWIKNRIYSASYPMNFKFEGLSVKPSFDGTIISAQKCLRYEGLFPSNVDYFNNWGVFSRKAGLAFQKKYGLAQTGLLDQTTKNMLTKLYP